MTFLTGKIYGNFKPRKTPNKERKVKAAARRPGMDVDHLTNIRKLSSSVSGRRPCQAHHLRIKAERGVALRATDRWAVPLTEGEHTRDADCVHSVGSRKEEAWFAARGVDCYSLANALWNARGDLETMERIVEAHRSTPLLARLTQEGK